MTAVVEETVNSRSASIGDSNRSDREYIVICDDAGDDESVADLAAFTAAPAVYRGYPKRNLEGENLVVHPYLIRKVKVNYGLDQNQAQPSNNPQSSNPTLSDFNTVRTFNLVGGTTHITTPRDTQSYPTGSAVDVKKTIGLDLKTGQVRGVDVFAPVADVSYTAQFPVSVVTDSFVDKLYLLTARTNNATWRGRPAGSLLFKGARGTNKGEQYVEITFEFAYSPNQTGLTIGGITGIDKKGWQYLDVMYREDATNTIGGQPIQIPAQVNIHTVFYEGDFTQLMIGT